VSDLSLQIAASGLEADQAELNTAANNLANTATPGYAEEVVNLGPLGSSVAGGVGAGVLVHSVSEDASSLDDQMNLIAQGQLGSATEAASIQGLAQDSFPEPNTTGLDAQLNQFFSGLSTLSTTPSSAAAEATVAEDARGVANTLNASFTQLSAIATQLQNDLQGQGSTTGGYVGQANQLINQIATLNSGIASGTSAPAGINSLLDQRRQAVDQLGTLLGVTTSTAPDGTMTVSSGGIELVAGTTATDLQVTGEAANHNLAVETTNENVLSPGGQIGALLTGVNTTIPNYQSQLSTIADSLATGINALQAGGVSASGTPGPASLAASPPYVGPLLPSFFVSGGSSTTYTTGAASAASIAVNPALLASPSMIATAAGSTPAGTATIDPATVQQMAALGSAPDGPTSTYGTLVDLVGSQTLAANNDQSAAQSLSDSTTAQLSTIEGVDSNRQTVDLLSAQQDYQAVAEVINSTTTALNALLAAV
jgi:flagellar hook-associated protein 1 FlgK